MRLEDLDLSLRQYYSLRRANINTSEELAQFDSERLKKVRNLSENDIKDLINKEYVSQ